MSNRILVGAALLARVWVLVLVAVFLQSHANGGELDSTVAGRPDYQSEIVPILTQYCYDCHADGADEGNFTLDHFVSPEAALESPELWHTVEENIRAGVMPPADSAKPSKDEIETIRRWIMLGPFKINPDNIDPGPIAVKRLNREQYGNTVRELMGVSFNEKLLFPPDDSGHGFDTVADAMMVSPLLLDKYLQAAELIVDRAVPKVTWIVPRIDLDGSDFRTSDASQRRTSGRRLDGKKAAVVAKTIDIDEPGNYSVEIILKQHGSFEFDSARYVASCSIDGKSIFSKELGWDENKSTLINYDADWKKGKHEIAFQLQPVVETDEDGEEMLDRNNGTSVSLEVNTVAIQGPSGTDRRVHPKNYDRFFTRPQPPADAQDQKQYAEETLRSFCIQAYRGPVETSTIDRLVSIAETSYARPDVTFEQGIGRAMIATLVSPRFLFRIESTLPLESDSQFALIDELSLAARLSYFLWSSMPDEELFELAAAGKLREQLSAQVDRMLKHPKAEAFVSNFVGQWLRTRDVASATVDPEVVLGFADEMKELREWFSQRRRNRRRRGDMSEGDRAKLARYREIRDISERIDGDLKRAMQQETELLVKHIVRQDASLLDLLDCDYTFLNEKLAEHYGIDGVKGREMRLVKLPADSPRGGVLTQASMLMVTSNPTRTSPVKRGLFVLENILGTPAPPAPGVVPELEASADMFKDHEPTLRELLEVHRESALCASCHARMDPIGLALENFDALGMWRDHDGDALIDPQGKLVTGETFEDVRGLKKMLRESHAQDFYRCVTEKLMIFAIGRGVEYTDQYTIDQIVSRLDKSNGKFRELVHAVVQSVPFQKQRVNVVGKQVAHASRNALD